MEPARKPKPRWRLILGSIQNFHLLSVTFFRAVDLPTAETIAIKTLREKRLTSVEALDWDTWKVDGPLDAPVGTRFQSVGTALGVLATSDPSPEAAKRVLSV